MYYPSGGGGGGGGVTCSRPRVSAHTHDYRAHVSAISNSVGMQAKQIPYFPKCIRKVTFLLLLVICAFGQGQMTTYRLIRT